jgi:prefoldin subunit 5
MSSKAMALLNSDWKSYMLGIFLVITTSLASVAYASITGQIADIKTSQTVDIKEAVKRANESAVDIAVLKSNITELKESIQRMETNQEKLLNKVDSLLQGVQRDSRRWNDEMNKRQAQRR